MWDVRLFPFGPHFGPDVIVLHQMRANDAPLPTSVQPHRPIPALLACRNNARLPQLAWVLVNALHGLWRIRLVFQSPKLESQSQEHVLWELNS